MIDYEPLFKYMKRKHITGYRMIKMGFKRATWYNLRSGKPITTKTLDSLCNILDCNIIDVLRYVETKEDRILRDYIKTLENRQ